MRLLAESSPLEAVLSLVLWVLGLAIVGTSIWLKIVCKQQNIWRYILKLLGVAALTCLVFVIIFRLALLYIE